MIDEYISNKKSNSAFYDSPPLYHLVPNFNTVSYAGFVEKTDVTLKAPRVTGAGTSGYDNVTSTSISGYKVSPHLAMSLKKVGLGFSAERGTQNSFFRYESERQSVYLAQESTLDYSGIGLNFSYLPFQTKGKFMSIATILGWKNFSARHKWSQYLNFNRSVGKIENTYKSSVRYNIDRYQAGLNINLALLKSFHVIPWGDFQYTETSDAFSAYQSTQRTSTIDPIFENDVTLFWLAEQNFNYGLDIAVRIMEFEVRLGGILGTFANLNPTPDTIEEKSISISLSWDQKG